jgi:hypothetical protein
MISAVALGLQHLGEAGGEREQGLAGAGLAEQGDEVDLRVHQQVEREVLLAVARGDAPHVVLLVAVVGQRLEGDAAAFLLLHPGLQRVVAVLVDELVDQHVGGERARSGGSRCGLPPSTTACRAVESQKSAGSSRVPVYSRSLSSSTLSLK